MAGTRHLSIAYCLQLQLLQGAPVQLQLMPLFSQLIRLLHGQTSEDLLTLNLQNTPVRSPAPLSVILKHLSLRRFHRPFQYQKLGLMLFFFLSCLVRCQLHLLGERRLI